MVSHSSSPTVSFPGLLTHRTVSCVAYVAELTAPQISEQLRYVDSTAHPHRITLSKGSRSSQFFGYPASPLHHCGDNAVGRLVGPTPTSSSLESWILNNLTDVFYINMAQCFHACFQSRFFFPLRDTKPPASYPRGPKLLLHPLGRCA
jgi:hypothetical protein